MQIAPMHPGAERREFQRLMLEPTIAATLGETPVEIREIGVLGSRVRHARGAAFGNSELRFAQDGNEIVMRCEVVRTLDVDDEASESGLRFIAAVGESGDYLRALLVKLVSIALEDLRSHTIAGLAPIDGDKTVRASEAGFLSYRLEGGVWTRRRILLPEQPASGFTVARDEDSEEMQRLCRVYQASDDEGRRLIRMFAELSVTHQLDIPPRH